MTEKLCSICSFARCSMYNTNKHYKCSVQSNHLIHLFVIKLKKKMQETHVHMVACVCMCTGCVYLVGGEMWTLAASLMAWTHSSLSSKLSVLK